MEDMIAKLTDWLKKLGGGASNPENCHVTAILLAAGMGSRMGNPDGVTKQMMSLGGMPVIARTIDAFEKSKAVREIVLVGRADELGRYEEMKQTYGFTKLCKLVVGGATRQESAIEGFKAVSDTTELVLIHDGARCLVTEEIIDKVSRAALVHGAAVAVEGATSTVKQIDAKGMIEQTLDRTLVRFAQTPQAFRTEVYRAAVYLTLSKGPFMATDDSMFAENIGLPVKAVECGDENIKITTRRDLYVAEAILAEREEKIREKAEVDAKTAADRAKSRAERKEARKL